MENMKIHEGARLGAAFGGRQTDLTAAAAAGLRVIR